MKRLCLALAGFLFLSPAQAQQTKQDLVSDINTLFPDNQSNLITAAQLRFVTTAIVSSYVDFITCAANGGVVVWAPSVSPTSSPTCLPAGVFGQVLRTGSTSPFWDNLRNILIAGTSINITGSITPTISISPVGITRITSGSTCQYNWVNGILASVAGNNC